MAAGPDPIIDDDNPEWTEADFAKAKPFKEVFPDLFASWEQEQAARETGAGAKVDVSLRLAADVVERIKAHGLGFDARVEKVLRDALARGEL